MTVPNIRIFTGENIPFVDTVTSSKPSSPEMEPVQELERYEAGFTQRRGIRFHSNRKESWVTKKRK